MIDLWNDRYGICLRKSAPGGPGVDMAASLFDSRVTMSKMHSEKNRFAGDV